MSESKKMLFDTLNKRGFRFPTSFIALDSETTAESVQCGRLPVQLALVEVVDGDVKNVAEIFLNWTVGNAVPANIFIAELNKISYIMQQKGETFPITYDMICQKGVPALVGLKHFMSQLVAYIDMGWPIVGHNIHGFDADLLDKAAHRYLDGFVIPWHKTSVLDTGLFQKAIKDDYFCYEGEPIEAWQRRVAKIMSNTKWNLRHCVAQYGLTEKLAGHAAHNAVSDCMAVAHLVHVFNRMLDEEASGKN